MLHRRVFLLHTFVSISFLVFVWPIQSFSDLTLRRITTTPDEVLNLNPTISGDGRVIAFESTFDLASTGASGVHALLASVSPESPGFQQFAASRAVAPAISQDGSVIAFTSTEDLTGENFDRNSEVFTF